MIYDSEQQHQEDLNAFQKIERRKRSRLASNKNYSLRHFPLQDGNNLILTNRETNK